MGTKNEQDRRARGDAAGETFRRGFAIEQDLGAMGGGQDQEELVDEARRVADGREPDEPRGDDPTREERDRRGKVERQEGGGIGGGWD